MVNKKGKVTGVTRQKEEEERKENVTTDEEMDLCGKCEHVVKDGQRGLECGLCFTWFHAGCEKVNKEEYDSIKVIGKKAQWFCRDCTGKFSNLQVANTKLKEENILLKVENQKLKDRIGNEEEY
ncbi:hypothetical protein Pmani_009586 [Petrolisthes manimaculis]|uniref:PHD-type domain-containing protein n=1 Tax=Petrolisthes manimaculis TaxID=1843537 RepID=A0AAE1Q3Z7_9EUCA|nr:hypothetical protein Pmani_009586 [Petrolisthes manimaculis]